MFKLPGNIKKPQIGAIAQIKKNKENFEPVSLPVLKMVKRKLACLFWITVEANLIKM